MNSKSLLKIIIVLVLEVSILSGCTEHQNISSVTEDKKNIEATSQDSSLNIDDDNEQDYSNDKIVKYYDTLDQHMQTLYNSFISCDWQGIIELLHEFNAPEKDMIAVYATPIEGVSLVIEYIHEVLSWQAYLGEFDGEQRSGKGIMVSERGRGNVFEGIYVGEWRENLPNGTGVLTDSTSDIEYLFVGTFIDGQFDSEVQVYVLEVPGLSVEWETLEPKFYIDASWTCATMTFENGKPVPLSIETVDEYIQISEWTEHQLSYLELENDGQYYYRIMGDRNAFILSIGVKEPADGYRASLIFCYGYFYDAYDQEGTYGVPCYSTNTVIVH